MQSLQHQEHSSSSCFYPQEMWNLNKTGIFLLQTRGNCFPEWRGVLEEIKPAPSPQPQAMPGEECGSAAKAPFYQ